MSQKRSDSLLAEVEYPSLGFLDLVLDFPDDFPDDAGRGRGQIERQLRYVGRGRWTPRQELGAEPLL